MVAKFLDDNKPVKSLKNLFALFQTSPILFSFINLANPGEIFFGPYLSLSKFKKKEATILCCVHVHYCMKRARESRKFHVVVV